MNQPIPTLSVIIPTYNRQASLLNCLDALAEQTMHKDRFEIIVVDNGSREPLDDALADRQGILNIKLIRKANKGPATARNTGAWHARGAFLVFTDDDCIPDPDWLYEIDRHFGLLTDVAVAGQSSNGLSDNLFSEASEVIVNYLRRYFGKPGRWFSFVPSNNLAISSTSFRAIGGFNSDFTSAAGEDRDFSRKLITHGIKIIDNPLIRISHCHHMGLSGFLHQHFQYGIGACQFHENGTRPGAGRLIPDSLAFYIRQVIYPILRHKQKPLRLFALLLISQAAVATSFIQAAITRPGSLKQNTSSRKMHE